VGSFVLGVFGFCVYLNICVLGFTGGCLVQYRILADFVAVGCFLVF